MSIFKYLKDSLSGIFYFFSLLSIINLILFSSTSFAQSFEDILYLNALLTALSLFFFFFRYHRWKSSYLDLKKAVERGDKTEHCLPKGDKLEMQLIRSIVEQKNEEMNLKVKSLQNNLHEINDYVSKWVHEIKLPISVCELIAEDSSSDFSVKASSELRQELERIKFLVNQVLYASRASSYSEDLFIEELNLERLVIDAAKRNSSFFIAKNIDLQLGNVNFNVLTDKKWTSYILDQIFNNACKYVGDNGRIAIYGMEDEKAVRLSIKDNGVGIAPSDIHRIFERGFTGNNGRRVAKSTGMGLYFSKKMAEKLGHDIAVSSEPECYTEFTLYFYKLSDYFNVSKMSH
ncbi:MAG: sensor histidine kinase [Clostridia bacterium]|nr:sensor histidine kinase [Clostridia bacterium]